MRNGIKVTPRTGPFAGKEVSTNDEGRGVFVRRADGQWQQQTGTAQTPKFYDAKQFARWVRSNWDDDIYDDNPPLIIWPNPPHGGSQVTVILDEQLSRRAYEMAYKHVGDNVDYKHDFAAGVCIWTARIGNKKVLLVERPDGKELWRDF